MKHLLFLLFLLTGMLVHAQDGHGHTSIDIHTNAVCDMCKKTIEGELIYEKGVKAVNLDLDANTIHVEYDAKRTDPDKLRTAVTKLGYMADDQLPDMKARKELPACCQKEGCGLPTEENQKN
ncbi:MAG: heavy-metal-associated domain-containing protein [Flavobacteriales bacterium]